MRLSATVLKSPGDPVPTAPYDGRYQAALIHADTGTRRTSTWIVPSLVPSLVANAGSELFTNLAPQGEFSLGLPCFPCGFGNGWSPLRQRLEPVVRYFECTL